MGKTKRGSKPAGYEYWSARPGNKHGGTANKFTKKKTHKAERAEFDSEKVTAAISEAIRSGVSAIYVDVESGEVEAVKCEEFRVDS